MSLMKDQSVLILFFLTNFTQYDSLQIHSHTSKLYDFIFSYSQIISQCAIVSLFGHLLLIMLFSDFDYCYKYCNENRSIVFRIEYLGSYCGCQEERLLGQTTIRQVLLFNVHILLILILTTDQQ